VLADLAVYCLHQTKTNSLPGFRISNALEQHRISNKFFESQLFFGLEQIDLRAANRYPLVFIMVKKGLEKGISSSALGSSTRLRQASSPL
jgi:hypothetical protein